MVLGLSDHRSAHALLHRVPWEARSVWVAPRPHPLLLLVTPSERSFKLSSHLLLSNTVLSYLWDNRVVGRGLFPATAFMEFFTVTTRSCLTETAHASVLALARASMNSALVLPDAFNNSGLANAALKSMVDMRMALYEVNILHQRQLSLCASGYVSHLHMESHAEHQASTTQPPFTLGRSLLSSTRVYVQTPKADWSPFAGCVDLQMQQIRESGYRSHPAAMDACLQLQCTNSNAPVLGNPVEQPDTRTLTAFGAFAVLGYPCRVMGDIQLWANPSGGLSVASLQDPHRSEERACLTGAEMKFLSGPLLKVSNGRTADRRFARRSVKTCLPTGTSGSLRSVFPSQLLELVSSLLGTSVHPDEPLMDAGLDSLGAAELRNSIARHFGVQPVELVPTLVFDYPTVTALAGYLTTEIMESSGSEKLPQGTRPTSDEQAELLHLQLLDLVTSILGTRVDPDEPLMDAGLDSLGAAELRTSIARHVGVEPVELVPTLIFDYPTLSALVGYLAMEHAVPAPSPYVGSRTCASTYHPTATLSMVQHVVTGMLGTVIPVDAHLMDAGLDYMGAVKLGKLLEQAVGIDLPDTLVFEYTSVAALGDYLEARLTEGAIADDSLSEYESDHAASVCGPSSSNRADPTSVLHSHVLELVTSLLGVPVEPDDPLMDLGLDSLAAAELRTTIARRVAVEPAELVPMLLFDYPTVRSLVGYLSTQILPTTPQVTQEALPRPSTGLHTTRALGMLDLVQGMVAGMLGALVPVDQHLMDAGLDFLGAVNLGDLIAQAVQTNLPHTLVFEYSTVRALATYLEMELDGNHSGEDTFADPGSEFGSCCSDMEAENALPEAPDQRIRSTHDEQPCATPSLTLASLASHFSVQAADPNEFQTMLRRVLLDELPPEVKESEAIDVHHLVDGLVESFGFIAPMLAGVPKEEHVEFTRRVVAAMLPVAGTVFVRLQTLTTL